MKKYLILVALVAVLVSPIAYGQETAKKASDPAAKATVQATTKEAVKEAAKPAVQTTTKEAVKEAAKPAVQTTTKETVKEAAKPAVQATTKEAVKAAAKAAVKTTTKEAVKATAKATVKATTKETVKEATKATVKAKASTKAKAKVSAKSSAKQVKCACEEGWVCLFDGKTLDGWEQLNGTAKYEVKDGMIVGTTAKGSPNSFLCTKKHYSDFILEFDVNAEDRLNSGVQFRSESRKDYQDGRVHGYQAEIATQEAGYIYDEARRGWLTNNRENPDAKTAYKSGGKWNHYRILCQGNTLMTWVNGIPVAFIEDKVTSSGFIGLQVHAFEGDTPASVAWKNIHIKELK